MGKCVPLRECKKFIKQGDVFLPDEHVELVARNCSISTDKVNIFHIFQVL